MQVGKRTGKKRTTSSSHGKANGLNGGRSRPQSAPFAAPTSPPTPVTSKAVGATTTPTSPSIPATPTSPAATPRFAEVAAAVPLAPLGLAVACLLCAGANALAGAHFISGRGAGGGSALYLLIGAVGLLLPLASAAHFARVARRDPSAVGLLMVCLSLAILVAMFDYSLLAGAMLHYCFGRL